MLRQNLSLGSGGGGKYDIYFYTLKLSKYNFMKLKKI